MNAKKILVPTDFSTSTKAALELAATLARDSGATLLIAHVEEPPTAYGGGEFYYGLEEPDRDELTKMLHEVVPSNPNVPCQYRMITGDPAHAIVKMAEEEDADMIVMASHGRTGLTRLLMGSVAEMVVRHAQCPVLTVKHPVGAKANAS
jgi:nucleotide-binding universal stress UspA family protein